MMTTSEKPKTSNVDSPDVAVTPKSSKAMIIWLAVVCSVLAVLWLETRSNVSHNLNLLINGEADTVGADVFIDGTKVGQMSASGNSGLGGGAFYAHVGDGPHVIEVKRVGYQAFSKRINMHREDYVGVSLVPNEAPPTTTSGETK